MESKKLEKPCENATFQALQGVMKPDEETGGVFREQKPAPLAQPAELRGYAPEKSRHPLPSPVGDRNCAAPLPKDLNGRCGRPVPAEWLRR